MSVILFRNGESHKFDEFTFVDRIAEGWSLTKDEAKDAPTVEVVTVGGEPDIDAMTKKELEIYARGFNDKDGNPIELDRRMNKNNMIKAFNEQKG